jgi:cell division protein FtsZ
VTLKGAKGLLLSITGGRDLTLYEVDEAASRVRQEVDPDANIIVGATFDDNLGDRIRVSIVASGMGRAAEQARPQPINAVPITAPATAPAQHAPRPNFVAGQVPQMQSAPAQAPQPMQPYQNQMSFPPVAQQPAVEMHRRLSEALQSAMTTPQAPIAHASYGGAPPQRQQREVWNGPNNVSIEEGFAHIGVGSQNGAAAPDYAPIAQAAPAYHQQGYHQGFQASPPVEAPRSSRRMPAVEDFPAVGQRDWHAKQAPAPAAANLSDDRKKAGFFGRLGGLGRKGPESGNPKAAENQNLAPSIEHDPPLPVFFGRERR